MTQPTGRGTGHLDVVARVALVVVLLALAAHGLSSRRHLDWAALDDTPQSPWVGLLLAGLAGAVVVAAARTLLRTLRQAASADPDESPEPDVEGKRLPWWFWPIACLVVLAVLVGVYEIVAHTVVEPLKLRNQGGLASDDVRRSGKGQPPVSGISLLALLLGGAAALLYFGGQLRAARRAARATLDDLPLEDEDPAEALVLAEAVEVAGDELGRHDDERTAILAAYAAMERHLAGAGAVRRASDTPTDFLRRAVSTARVSRGAASTLTELFREARFSTHPMPAGAREDAARALARVAADLTDVRA